MALDYANFELIQNMKRNLKGTAPKEKLSELEDKIQVVIPINSANQPLAVCDTLMDFDSVPKNYLTSNVAKDDAVADTTYTTLNTITVPSGYYYFVWGIQVSAAVGTTAGKDLIAVLTTDAAQASVNDTDNLFTMMGNSETCAWKTLLVNFTKPIPITTGSVYLRVYHNKGGACQVHSSIRLEVRKIENRDP